MSEYSFAPSAASLTNLYSSTRATAGTLTLSGALVTNGIAALGEQAHLSFQSVGDLSGLQFTITGVNRRGVPIVETIAGPNANTVYTAANYKNVISVYVNGGMGGITLNIGNADSLETAWVSMNSYAYNKGISVIMTPGSSFTYEVQYSPQDWNRLFSSMREDQLTAFADTVLTGKTATAGIQTVNTWPMVRLKITNFVSGGGTLLISESAQAGT